ncbi:carbonic anhydrase OS=Tsukamurella paurometabola (strain ATCC 8368 / DSM / CCUG 35730 / CIP 100753 / JCM 10117 / KCTC 9821 / NBRC 16120 / NCIMB 702349 /NCTC 13040) OX=521096 GN=Tpau_0095 PE=3 SV=1 [Tsukamurella paurometabola]|uniref:carbonic anhydrase n=1 Tax=Tsukamurella paurometabola (strain ATCC 8368 / DSM 20162 / CCUG 35730 / CIP 100753 / JCM 10117 / KCTC 9821 / NBRC 16120 / NCIMB 702349 / NCTC 13040) TaxID=521096 RepID=D5UPY1_TSUPD|nr:bifunctional SulP family inorganic anion transporter/carbonic anhydrase [Tsukamurella paurometabola]ADG76749.1 Carbonate dehydratase [Tsukamurella paurometabola DSM 20162]SUP41465.1 Carbonic anhydrase 1 [Tsukamurella paurometabola]
MNSSIREGVVVQEKLREVVRFDVPASIVVFLVALPLSLGIALASGAPLMAGLIAGVIGGIVGGLMGGSPLLVSGPAAGLTVVVAELINKFGWKVTAAITVAAGLVQIGLGMSRIARAALAISPVVVHAMLAGIGVTIVIQQTHVLFGGTSRSSVLQNLIDLPARIGSMHWPDFAVGAIVIAVMLLWPKLPPKWRRVPGALVAIVAATVFSLVVPMNVERIKLNGSIIDAIGLPQLPTGQWAAVALGVLTVALIASVESLLSAVAVDKMHDGAKSNLDRELIGQGAANSLSGLLGGLPVTGVIVRSATNVTSGARTRWSAVLHGVWLLLFSVALSGLVEKIPTSALAGLLIVIGVQLVKTAHIRTARRTGDIAVYAVTILGVLFLNLLEGVLAGLVVAILLVLWRVARASIEASQDSAGRWHVAIDGSLSFFSLPRLSRVLASVPPGGDVAIELTVDFLDHASAEEITEWVRRYRAGGGTVTIDDLGVAQIHAAGDTSPRRTTERSAERGLLPWRAHARGGLADGIARYHRRHASLLSDDFDGLIDGQRPEALFLTCADSRVVPNVITASGPGDLFTVRNVGNLVPAGGVDGSLEAALTYAVDNLDVNQVIVCGHSGCGAMGVALDRPAVPPSIEQWIEHADASVEAYREGHPVRRAAEAAGFGPVDQLAVVNIAVQLENLRNHPLLREAVAEGRIDVVGLFFDIGTGRVLRVTDTAVVEADTLTHV